MKTSLLRVSLLLGLVCAIGTAAWAADAPATPNPYEIRKIQRGIKKIAYVDNGWRNSVPAILAELRVNSDIGDAKPFARAYFFDRDNKLVHEFKGPVQASDDHKNYTSLPAIFKPREGYEVCFPISDKATQRGEKWARVVVVFGDANSAVAECYPKDELAKFDFPEKTTVLKGSASSGSKR